VDRGILWKLKVALGHQKPARSDLKESDSVGDKEGDGRFDLSLILFWTRSGDCYCKQRNKLFVTNSQTHCTHCTFVWLCRHEISTEQSNAAVGRDARLALQGAALRLTPAYNRAAGFRLYNKGGLSVHQTHDRFGLLSLPWGRKAFKHDDEDCVTGSHYAFLRLKSDMPRRNSIMHALETESKRQCQSSRFIAENGLKWSTTFC
jgi:hypothetical protein